MQIRIFAAIVLLSFASPSLAQESQPPASPTPATESTSIRDEDVARIRAFTTLLAAACTPELEAEARKGRRACALIWYALAADQNTIRLPSMLAKSGYRPVIGMNPSEDGNPLKAKIRVAHPQTGLVSTHMVSELADGMIIEYRQRGSETLNYRYVVVGVIFPALCQAYPDKCGMKSYKARVFDLREYNEDTFDAIAPGHSDPFAGAIPLPQ